MQWIYCYFMESISMDFGKVIYENIEKKHSFHNKTHLYLWSDILKFYEVLFCAYYKQPLCLYSFVHT